MIFRTIIWDITQDTPELLLTKHEMKLEHAVGWLRFYKKKFPQAEGIVLEWKNKTTAVIVSELRYGAIRMIQHTFDKP